jgi:hypothetical protein
MNAMEYWSNGVLAPVKCEKKISRGKNIGFGGMRSAFYMDGPEHKIKTDSHPLLIPNIPLFHHFVIPLDVSR